MRVRDRDVPDSLASVQLPKPPLASVRERIKNGVCPNPVYPLRHFRNPQKPPKLLAELALYRLRFPQRPVVEVDQPQAPSIRIRKCSFQITRPKLIF